jgi:hypothetical protein
MRVIYLKKSIHLTLFTNILYNGQAEKIYKFDLNAL